MFKKINFYQLTITITAVLFASTLVVYGWTAPVGSPPGNDVLPPINTGLTAQAKLGGLIIGTGISSSQTALSIPIGNLAIGTSTAMTKPGQGGFLDVKDAWLRDANGGIGGWASALGGGGALALDPSKFYTRPAANVAGQLDCLTGDTMISGSCVGYDVCDDQDSTSFGGYPSGNGWYCPSVNCTRITTYVRCYTTAATTPMFCSNGTQPGQSTYGAWGACSATVPQDVCQGQGCFSGLISGYFYGTETRTVQTCKADGNLATSVESRPCFIPGSYCSDYNSCYVIGG